MINVKNRKCIHRLSARSLWASRKRNAIAITAIALTTLLFTSLFTIVMSMNSSYEIYSFRQAGGYNHGTFKDVTDEQADAITAHPRVKAVGKRTPVGVADQGVFAKIPAEISYMDPNCMEWSYALPQYGHMPEGEKEIAMDTGALALLGIEPKVGALVTLTWTLGDNNQTGSSKTDTFILSGWWDYNDLTPVHYINVSEEYAAGIEAECVAAGMDPFRTDLNVMMVSALNIRGQMEQVDLDLGYDWESYEGENSVRIGVNWGYTSSQLFNEIDVPILLGILAFLLLVIFTGYLIIYNIFQISVSEDIRFYGLLKTIGVTPRQLRRIIRRQAMLLCVIGLPIGLLAGYGVGAILAPFVIEETILTSVGTTLSVSPLIFLISGLFALFTVLLSCSRPGRIASKVSPVEAVKYTDVTPNHGRRVFRTVLMGNHRRRAAQADSLLKGNKAPYRGAGIGRMAFANLGRNKRKTALVAVSLSLSLVLLDILIAFVGGFDGEKYLSRHICADFIVSGTDYFRFNHNYERLFPPEMLDEINENTSRTQAGCGYTITQPQPIAWMSQEAWKMARTPYYPDQVVEEGLSRLPKRGDLVSDPAMIEGMDDALFEKLTVIEGNLSPLFEENSTAIAIPLLTDDYGRPYDRDRYPDLGTTQTITYIKDAYYLDSRTGERSTEDTPEEYLEYYIADSHDVDYTICAFVSVPNSIDYRYNILGSYHFVLPAERLKADSGQSLVPLFYMFDTPDLAAEEAAEQFVADLTDGDLSGLMYESKATIRKEFASFKNIFLLLGGFLCTIIGLVGILNYFNAIMTGILSRKREFAVLKAIGMTNRQLKTMLIFEGLFYSLGSAMIALILSLLLGPLAGNLLENMFWFYSANFTVLPVLAAIPVFALSGWLIPFLMYGQTTKRSVVEQLRET